MQILETLHKNKAHDTHNICNRGAIRQRVELILDSCIIVQVTSKHLQYLLLTFFSICRLVIDC